MTVFKALVRHLVKEFWIGCKIVDHLFDQTAAIIGITKLIGAEQGADIGMNFMDVISVLMFFMSGSAHGFRKKQLSTNIFNMSKSRLIRPV